MEDLLEKDYIRGH